MSATLERLKAVVSKEQFTTLTGVLIHNGTTKFVVLSQKCRPNPVPDSRPCVCIYWSTSVM